MCIFRTSKLLVILSYSFKCKNIKDGFKMEIKYCPYCDSKRLYNLQDNYKKCSSCNRKFSTRKIETNHRIIEFFCNNISANRCAKILKINYRTVQNRYMFFRKLIANF